MKWKYMRALHRMMVDINRNIVSLISAVPKSVYNNLLKQYEKQSQIIRFENKNNTYVVSTSSRLQIADLLNEEFNILKDKKLSGNDYSNNKKRLSELFSQYFMLRYISNSEFYLSKGSESGTFRILNTDFRIKKILCDNYEIADVKAKNILKINDIVEKICPGQTVFNEYITLDNQIILMSEEFQGEKLLNNKNSVPLELIVTYFDSTIKLLNFNWIKNVSTNYAKEVYKDKIFENLAALSNRYTISSNTVGAIYDIIGLYESNAHIPFLDRSLKNTKYNGNILKQFDFTKFETLVIPLYDLVQITFQYGKNIDYFKSRAKQAIRISDFDLLWELSAFYYLTRQIRNSLVAEDSSNYAELESLLLNQEFCKLDPAKQFVEDIKRSINDTRMY